MHSEWSWDTTATSMERSCARAVELGLPSIAFTEHAEFTLPRIDPRHAPRMSAHFRVYLGPDGLLRRPELDVAGYLAAVRRCRERFPGLRIRSGVELSEPHWHPDRVAALLAAGGFDQVLGSVHALAADPHPVPADQGYLDLAPEQVVRDYLAEADRLAGSSAGFSVLAHLDYPVRYLPGGVRVDWPGGFEDEVRAVLGTLARSGRALEVNTRLPAEPAVLGWWRDAGGAAVSFGSDAHVPSAVGRGFAAAAAVVTAYGFGPAADPTGPWTRRSVR